MNNNTGETGAMASTKDIEQFFTALLKPFGARKKGRNWCIDNGYLIASVNLQKSAWGDQHYINIGLNIKSIDPTPTPTAVSCMMRTRSSTIVPKDLNVEAALDLESGELSNDQRQRILEEALCRHIVPFIQSLNSDEDINVLMSDERSTFIMVSPTMLEFLRAHQQ